MKYFHDRIDAGKQLATTLLSYVSHKNVVVLGLPRGGVPVAYQVATKLHAPLSVLLVRKLGVPDQEEVAMGAIAEEDSLILNEDLISQLQITPQQIQQTLQKEKRELSRRVKVYRQNKPLPNIHNKTVILIDDGIATGATCKAALQTLKKLNPKEIILAVPVASKEAYQELKPLVQHMICLSIPVPFYDVGSWYKYFDQTTDEEVQALLHNSMLK